MTKPKTPERKPLSIPPGMLPQIQQLLRVRRDAEMKLAIYVQSYIDSKGLSGGYKVDIQNQKLIPTEG